MIKNIWNMIEVYCGNNHKEEQKMEIQNGMYQMFYACPKYHIENRNPEERACNNRISMDDYEYMVSTISKLLEEAEMNNSSINLKNYKWTKKNIEYVITEHTNDKIKVYMRNKVAIKK